MVCDATVELGIEIFALGRKFFISKKGYFGLGPPGAKKGDRIAVLLGNDVPFILRRRGELGEKQDTGKDCRGWEVIGETYVHGIMKGEVVRQWEMGYLETSKIMLQ